MQSLENVSFFVKCKLPAKDVNDKDVSGSLPVKQPGTKIPQKKKSPSTLRHSKTILRRCQEKKAAEKAVLPKSPATPLFRGEDSCTDLEKVAPESLGTTGHPSDLTCSDNSGKAFGYPGINSNPCHWSNLCVTEEQEQIILLLRHPGVLGPNVVSR